MKRIVIIAVVCALAMSACNKVDYNTEYVIKPFVQQVDKGEELLLGNVVAYGLDGDTATWKISSLDDARAGIFTNAVTKERRSYDRTATPDGDGNLVFTIRRERSLVSVCSLDDPIYGWRNLQIGYNMPSIEVLIKFRPWRKVASYDEMRWRMVRAEGF